jgi:hypothetical protein
MALGKLDQGRPARLALSGAEDSASNATDRAGRQRRSNGALASTASGRGAPARADAPRAIASGWE